MPAHLTPTTITNKTYFINFFIPLCASLSNDEFLAFAEAVVANLEADALADATDIALLKTQAEKLRTAHVQRGVGGKSASVATLRTAVREFLAWVQLTNVQKVLPAFPSRTQAERIDILPGSMDALYQAAYTNILGRAKHYLDKVSTTYGGKTGITATDATAQYKKLEDALTSRTTDASAKRGGSVAVGTEEAAVCQGLYRSYAGLLHRHYEHPERAYAYFPFPNSTGTPADGNLASVPKPHPADAPTA